MSNKQMIEIKIPKGYMNCGISKDNYFIADTNYSKNWDTIRLPLPVPQFTNVWSINHYSDDFTIVYLEEIQEGNKETTMSNKQKPPLGLMPYSIFLLRRLEDIFQAIERYYEGNIQIPIEWIKEYNLLIEMYKNNLGKDEQ